jgi:hypothetical protein
MLPPMRYRDAAHVDVQGFYARNPTAGKWMRMAGYLGIVAAVAQRGDPTRLAAVLVIMIVLWLIAWYCVVGTLWRSSLVAAILVSALQITAARCPCCRTSEIVRSPAGPTPSSSDLAAIP